jgi:hypothetical protein
MQIDANLFLILHNLLGQSVICDILIIFLVKYLGYILAAIFFLYLVFI